MNKSTTNSSIAAEANEVINDFMATHPGRIVKEVYKFANGYFVAAPTRGVDEDFSDPFFIISKKDGKVIPFIPSQDFNTYEKMTRYQIYGD